jgi:hypothetical protein
MEHNRPLLKLNEKLSETGGAESACIYARRVPAESTMIVEGVAAQVQVVKDRPAPCLPPPFRRTDRGLQLRLLRRGFGSRKA